MNAARELRHAFIQRAACQQHLFLKKWNARKYISVTTFGRWRITMADTVLRIRRSFHDTRKDTRISAYSVHSPTTSRNRYYEFFAFASRADPEEEITPKGSIDEEEREDSPVQGGVIVFFLFPIDFSLLKSKARCTGVFLGRRKYALRRCRG